MSNRTSMHSVALGAVLFATCFTGVIAVAPEARAQSCDESVTVHSSYPADGATDVATNAALYLYGPELDADSDVTLQEEGGDAVMIDVQPVDGGVLVDAFLGLAPSTSYELTVAAEGGGEEWSASFTTGTGPASIVQLREPEVGVSVIEHDRGSCVVTAICVVGTVAARRTLEVIVGDEVMSVGNDQRAPAFLASGSSVAANGCVEVRVREPGGVVSEATRLCGAQLGRYELAANAAAPTSCQPYSAVPDADDADDADDGDSESSESGGCSMRGGRGAASGAGGLLLGVGALLAARWRRARGARRRLTR